MSFISLIFGLGAPQTRIGSIPLDALLDETTKLSSNVTDYPVEEGSPINDHVANASERLMLRGVVTGAGLILFQGGGRSKLIATKEMFRELHESRTEITIVTGSDTYVDVVMTDLDITRNSAEEKLNISVEFKKIRKAITRTADIPPEKVAPKAKGKAGATKASGGKVSNTESVAPNEGISQSKLKDILSGKPTINFPTGAGE